MYCPRTQEAWKSAAATVLALALVVAFFAILPFVNRINVRRTLRAGGDLSAFATAPVRPAATHASPELGAVTVVAQPTAGIAPLAVDTEELKVAIESTELPVLEPLRLQQEAKRAFEFDASDLDFTPMPIHRVPPEYPYALKQQGIEGRVVVEFRVDPEGRVTDVQLLETSHEDFARSVLDAVARWRFVPGMVGGDAVRFRMRLPVNFRLLDTRPPPAP